MTDGMDPAAIEELDIVRAPGFETEGFALNGFSSGINLIHGPNAAGKTTTADSIERLLWPDAADDGEQLVGQLMLNGERWRVDVVNGHVEYQRNGQEAAAPNLPSVEQRDRYRLSLHDLLQQETRNESFAKTIERESAGGCDLSAAHDELNYRDSPITRRKGVYQDADEAVETWRDERTDAKGLEEERSRLTKLRNELEEAKQARDVQDVLDQAITYCDAKSKHEAAQEKLDEFDGALEQVDGDELDQVETLDEQIAEWEEEKQGAEDKKQDAKTTLEEVALPEGGISEGIIARFKERRDALDECESREEAVNEELEGVKEEQQSAREDIPFDIDHDELVDLDPGTWADVSDFARTAEQVQAERQRREVLDQWADTEEPSEADVQTLERGSKALEEWLMAREASTGASGGKAAFRIGAVSAAVVSLAGIILGILVNPILFGVILVGIALFVYGYQQREDTESSGSQQESHRDSFEQMGLESPESWTEGAVRDRLVEMYDELAAHKVVKERQQQRDTIVAEQDLDRKKEALMEQREELREKVGAAPETTDIELAVIVRRVLDWQDAHDEVVRLQAELDQVQENLAEANETLQSELAEYGYDDVEDAATATQRIRNLEQRQSEHETATRKLDTAEESIEKAMGKLGELRDGQEEVFIALSLEPGDRDTLQALCEQVDEYEETRREVEQTEAVLEQERETLEELPEYDPELKEREITDLKQELREVKETAARRDEIQSDIADIEARIREAKSSTTVEDAIAERNQALAALEEQLTDDYAAMVGDVLVDHVQEVTIEASRPRVFQRANELLATITHGRYELLLDEGEQTFRAYDTAKQRGFALDELSSGTRVQVLLAVRLAFVEQQEQQTQLPLILDETLANTDDLRAEVIIDSLIELARDGRQIFYFTAQGDEVAKWRTALEDTADVEWTTIDLAEVRDLDRAVDTPELDSVESLTPNPPGVAGHNHESYGEALNIEPFNPYDGAGTAHLWYLVEDVEVLHDLLSLSIERWGQLQNLIERGRDEFIPADVETLSEIQQNGTALEAFVEAWQIGRGDPVDRSVLEASGAVSDTFINRVTDLAEELGGDAEQLVEALYAKEVDRFRQNKAEDLEDYLRENGYIVSREPLDNDEIRIRMIDRLVSDDVPREQAVGGVDDLLARIAEDKQDD
jgi:DNA repair exonuclease SbcCD ATPase subunit